MRDMEKKQASNVVTVNAGEQTTFDEEIEIVVAALRDAGFDPFDQLIGYVLTGNELCITRRANARDIVSGMDRGAIKNYLFKSGKWPKRLL